MKKLYVIIILMLITISSFSQNYSEYNANIFCMNNQSAIDWGDFDNDGDLDILAVTTDSLNIYEYTDSLYSFFGHIHPVNEPKTAKWGNINNDTLLDFILFTQDSIIIYQNTGGSFVKTSNQFKNGYPYSNDSDINIEWGDYDNDDDMDILIHEPWDSTYILDNEAGIFQFKHSEIFGEDFGSYATWGDYDNDGDLDMATVKTDSSISIWKYETDTYVEIPTGLGAISGIKWGDLDNDNDLDLIFSSSYYHTNVSENNGGSFLTPTLLIDEYHFDSRIDVKDFDNDSDQDILMEMEKYYDSPNDNVLYIFENLGDFSFHVIEVYEYLHIDYNRNIITKWGDFDNDNDDDILISRYGMTEFWNQGDETYILENTGNHLNYADNICQGETTYLNFVTIKETSQLKYSQWELDSGIISSGEGTDSINVSWMTAGDKDISFIYSWDSIYFDTVQQILSIHPSPITNVGNDFSTCSGELLNLTNETSGGTPPYTFQWNECLLYTASTDSIYTVSLDTSMSYLFVVTDQYGCIAQDTLNIFVQTIYSSDEICLVTVDSATGKNVIIWEKELGKGTDYHTIYKEGSVGGTYDSIGIVGYDSIGIFVDTSSNPMQHFDRYKLRTIDTCGNISDYSDFHQTIHLSINQGLPGTINLKWTPYVGFEYSTYYILKGSRPDNMVVIEDLANTHSSYTDLETGIAYYQVAVQKENPCIVDKRKAMWGKPRNISSSNIEDTRKFVGITEMNSISELKIYPNPVSDIVTLQYTLDQECFCRIVLYNYTGSCLKEIANSVQIAGTHEYKLNLNDMDLPSGIYFLRFDVKEGTLIKRIVKAN